MDEETIMPDGRPFFAWENELALLRKNHEQVREERESIKEQFRLLGVVEIERKDDPSTLDMLFRVSFRDVLHNKELNYDISQSAEKANLVYQRVAQHLFHVSVPAPVPPSKVKW